MPTHTIATEVAGTVWKVLVNIGDEVAAEQELAIVESMKMEIPCTAPHAGVVQAVLVAEGDSLQEGQAVVLITAAV
jgi:acetyl-CoA carboxylase biotin carboxyl carrier protein